MAWLDAIDAIAGVELSSIRKITIRQRFNLDGIGVQTLPVYNPTNSFRYLWQTFETVLGPEGHGKKTLLTNPYFVGS